MFFAQDDKRAFRRMELDVPIEITKGEITIKGICKDLSSTGMLITFTENCLQADNEVHIKLDTDDDRFPPLDAEATLLRVDKHIDYFTAAVKFINMK